MNDLQGKLRVLKRHDNLAKALKGLKLGLTTPEEFDFHLMVTTMSDHICLWLPDITFKILVETYRSYVPVINVFLS